MLAKLGCQAGLHEWETEARLVSQHLGPNSWVRGGVGREGEVDDGGDEERRCVTLSKKETQVKVWQ